jgi:hypothetical protein
MHDAPAAWDHCSVLALQWGSELVTTIAMGRAADAQFDSLHVQQRVLSHLIEISTQRGVLFCLCFRVYSTMTFFHAAHLLVQKENSVY